MEISLENYIEINGKVFLYLVILNMLIVLAVLLMEKLLFFQK